MECSGWLKYLSDDVRVFGKDKSTSENVGVTGECGEMVPREYFRGRGHIVGVVDRNGAAMVGTEQSCSKWSHRVGLDKRWQEILGCARAGTVEKKQVTRGRALCLLLSHKPRSTRSAANICVSTVQQEGYAFLLYHL